MRLYIRADADSKMGTGHIMRCIALAQTWQDQGGEVTFIGRCDCEPLKQRIRDEGFSFIPIDRICPDPSDLKTTLSILKNDITGQKTWLVLDGYHFTPEYQKAIRDAAIRILVIDDMNHLPYYHADILLNQNIHAPELKYPCDEDKILLLGTRYVLLRREFLKYREFKRQIPDRAKNILVTLGGADPDNVTLKAIEAVKFLNVPDIALRIIIGPANPHHETLRKAISSAHFDIELLINPLNVPELMACADIAISAGGSTSWELAFMGLPALLIVLAENQRRSAKLLAESKVFLGLGDGQNVKVQDIAQALKNLLQNCELQKKLSQKGHLLVDGMGVERVIEILSKA